MPGGFAGAIHQQNDCASKLGRKQIPPDLFLPKGNIHFCILFVLYDTLTHVTLCNQLHKCCGAFVTPGRPGTIFSWDVTEILLMGLTVN